MVGVALAFCAGVALRLGGPVWCAALLLLLVLLRPRFPFHRPGPLLLAGCALVGAGFLHGMTTVPPGPWIPGARAPAAEAGADTLPPFRDRAQEALSGAIHRAYPAEGAMVDALLLARRQGMDRGVRDSFIRTGAAHLLAISGFHVGVLAGWAMVLLRLVRAGRRRAAVGAALLVWGYVALLGFPTSAVRAGLLLSGAALGRLRERPVHPLGGWGLALLVVAVTAPGTLLRPGTQLSFAGALGLILWAGPWSRALNRGLPEGGRLAAFRRGMGEAVAASAAAQVATLPLAVWHFQRVSVLALPATLVVTPLISLALPGALLGLLLDRMGIPGAGVVTGGVEGLLWASRVLLGGMAGWDPGWFLGPAAVGTATVAGVAAWRFTRRGRGRRWRTGAVTAAVMAAVWFTPGLRAAAGPDGVEIHLLDVGQGDAIAIRTPRGRWILVDAGPGSGDGLVRELAILGVTRLEAMVLTHPDLDHIGGAASLLETLAVGGVVDGGSIRGTRAFQDVSRLAEAEAVPWRTVRAGDGWEVDGVEFQVLHPSGLEPADTPPNDLSVVLHLRWGEFDALLTGDISREVEMSLLDRLQPVELLKVGHHGSRTSTAPEFLERTRPMVSAISLGRRNRHGHPAPEVMARLREAGGMVLRTDQQGRVTIRGTEDGTFTVGTEREGGD